MAKDDVSRENPIIYVILNGELGMSPGKACAQSVHAAMLLDNKHTKSFVAGYKRTVVILEAENGETLKNLLEYLQGAGIFASYYIDEISEKGKPYQVTALAVEPIDHDDEEKRSIFESFPLFNGYATIKRVDKFGMTAEKKKIKNGSITDSWWLMRLLKGVK